jgi:nickel transport protein
MPGRIRSLSAVRGIAALMAALLLTGEAPAHRLDAQAFLLPNRQIQVESWFSTGDVAKGAKVQVFDSHEQLVTEGQLNEQGIFVFPAGKAERLKVVISAGAGHRKELTIWVEPEARSVAAEKDEPAPVPLAERDAGASVKDILVGVGFLLAVAAFVLSLRNARRLNALERANPARSLPRAN